jgi:DNA processing protein
MDILATAENEGTSLDWFAGAGLGPREEQRRLQAAGARLVGWDDPTYPTTLRGLTAPPLVLAVRGTLVEAEPVVAIVGTHRADEYGRRMADRCAGSTASASGRSR